MTMALFFGILHGTPPWVFALAVLLVWLGARSLRPRVTSVGRVFITPAVFIAWGLASLATNARTSPRVVGIWLLTAAAGLLLAVLTVRMAGLRVDRARRLVLLPASVLPLVRNLLVFSAKYTLGVAMALYPDLRGSLALWDMAVSGASAGYFFGWAARFGLMYRDAATAELVETRRTR